MICPRDASTLFLFSFQHMLFTRRFSLAQHFILNSAFYEAKPCKHLGYGIHAHGPPCNRLTAPLKTLLIPNRVAFGERGERLASGGPCSLPGWRGKEGGKGCVCFHVCKGHAFKGSLVSKGRGVRQSPVLREGKHFCPVLWSREGFSAQEAVRRRAGRAGRPVPPPRERHSPQVARRMVSL